MKGKKVIYYYQTFDGLGSLIEKPTCSHIHVSSIHFGTNQDGSLYIHLNDNSPSDPVFDSTWKELEQISQMGVKIVLMIGGAGGGYQALFQNFEAYYAMLRCCLTDHPYISGIDLDVEENVKMSNIQMLIRRFKADYPEFTVAMAPVQSSLQEDIPGLGGFCYKELLATPEGKQIDYLNGQFYTDYSVSAYQQVIQNGYSPSQVVMGMSSEMFNAESEKEIKTTLKQLVKQYPDFGGVFDWEHFNAYPSSTDWSGLMTSLMDPPIWFSW